ncbi:PspC domain-containing protein [Sphingomicrobium nitratireducens]|uniref:PspC domain-containing protein n=1 Tax=Sphingomicrobium nitratireducens TaxID=2964666 RepID=UPI00223F7468|nr:PspC domain-containing protein [Sphingomicrobium nitratireducens]
MEEKKPNMFTRNDTIFGVCEALGEDLGFNPLWLRLAFIAPLFWVPVQMVVLYLALGALVFVSRRIAPAKEMVVPHVTVAEQTMPVPASDAEALAEAA